MNSLVLTDEQRAATTNPIVRQLIPLIPPANFFDAAGTPRFVGSAPAVADTDRWSIDVRHNAGKSDRIHAFYGTLRRTSLEPAAQGNSISGFGTISQPFASVLTVGGTHLFGSALVNEAVFGRSYVKGITFPAAPLNPSDFGVAKWGHEAHRLPQMIVAGDLNFGGPGTFPQGRTDTLVRVPRHVQRRAPPSRVEVRRRVSSLHQRELRRRHGSLQLPERGRIPGRGGQCLQHHAGRTAERDRSAGNRAFCPGRRQPRRRRHHPDRDALRVARHAYGAGRSLHRVRRGQCIVVASRQGRPGDLRTEQPELRATLGCGVGSEVWWPDGTARGLCASGGSTWHDRGAGHSRQSAVRRAADGSLPTWP